MKEIIRKYENNTLAIGEVLGEEYQINNFSGDWMNFSDPEKVSLFKETVEGDKKFSGVVSFVDGKVELNVGEFIPELVGVVDGLSIVERFISYIYCQLCCKLYTVDTNRPFVVEAKRMRVGLGGRIGDHNQNETYYIIAKNFGFRMSSWDGETAVKDPLRDGSSCWDVNYQRIVQQYLVERGVNCQLIDEQERVNNILTQLLKIDRKLVGLKKRTGLKDEELKKYFKVDNLHASFCQFSKAVEVLTGHNFHSRGVYAKAEDLSYVEGDFIINEAPDYVDSPKEAHKFWMCHANRRQGVATTIYFSKISVVADGLYLGSISLPFHYCSGGPWRKYFKVDKVVDVKIDDKIMVIYIDGNGERREVKINE